MDMLNSQLDSSRLRQIRCWLLDMDGTITLEEETLPGSEDFFAAIAGSDALYLVSDSGELLWRVERPHPQHCLIGHL